MRSRIAKALEKYERKRESDRISGAGDEELIKSLKPAPTPAPALGFDNRDEWPERKIQKEIAKALRAIGLTFWHTVNESGGRRNAIQGRQLKLSGLRAGVYDIIIADKAPNLPEARCVAIELKTAKGRESPAQKEWAKDVRACGWFTAVAFGYDNCMEIIEELGYGQK